MLGYIQRVVAETFLAVDEVRLCVLSCSTSAVTSSQSSFGAMAVDLTPRQPKKTYGGEGGAYYEWSPADLPMLGVASIGAAKLSLAAGSLSLPSYSDSAKVAYVLQGTCTTRFSDRLLVVS